MNGDSARGHHLEQRIAGFLEQHGYTVTTNVRVPGRSGAIHELDVVGDKSDGLTTFRLVVECKAWASSIDKDVIYKLGAELADLGAARGIVVALSGWTAREPTSYRTQTTIWSLE
jgi:Holliday junction resolvase